MKLIIDIEPRYCKNINSDVKGLYYEAINRITEAVSNGVPYDERPQDKWGKWVISEIQCPTVPLPDFKEGYKQAIIDGKTNFSRQKGEWVIGETGTNNFCSVCKEFVLSTHYNFCPNCGADMRGIDNG